MAHASWVTRAGRVLVGTAIYVLAFAVCMTVGCLAGLFFGGRQFDAYAAEHPGVMIGGLFFVPYLAMGLAAGLILFGVFNVIWSARIEEWVFQWRAREELRKAIVQDPDPLGIIATYEAEHGPLPSSQDRQPPA